jgi:hypothetical protein
MPATSPVSPRSQEPREDNDAQEISSRNPTPGFLFHLFSLFPFDLVNNRY